MTPPMRAGGTAMVRRPDAAPGSLGGVFRGIPHGYKTRVFTGAICPLPHQTETVVSKGAPT